MKMKLASILALFILNSGPALAADNGRIETPAMDEWDDDMWSDWGTPSQGATKAPTEDLKEPAAPSNDIGLPTAFSFGETGTVRFRLVRDTGETEARGVRKYRPNYSRARKRL